MTEAPPSTFDRAWGRRSVVVAGGAAAGLVALQATPGGRALLSALVSSEPERRVDGSVRVERVRRAADQLSLDIVLVDMVVETRGDDSWVGPSGSSPGYLGFVLPAQSVGEEYSRATTALSSTSAYVQSEMGLPTVLAFAVPVGTQMAFDLPALLDWEGLGPLWTGDATRPSSVIEAPYRVRLKPHTSLVWEHDAEPRTEDSTGGTTELWHTRLETVDFEGAATKRILTVPATLTSSLKLPLDAIDRKRIKQQANTYNTSATHAPVVADRLILTPLGATLELHGAWPGANDLVSWDHRSTLGRDQYVKTVNRGYLAPWGHPAVLIEETWRRMRTASNGRPVAVLQKITTILVAEPVVDTKVEAARTTGSGPGKVVGGSRLPFVSVRCRTRLSPPLRDREVAQIKVQGGVPVLEEDASLLRLPFEGTDWEGNVSVFTSVVSFVPGEKPPKGVALGWNGEDESVRTVDLAGQPMAVAPVRTSVPGSTRLPVGLAPVKVAWIPPEKLVGKRAPFRPYLASMMATVPALSALTGKGELKHSWPISYVLDQDNPGGVVLRADKPAGAPIDAQRTGGMAPPPTTYQGFSSTTGAVLASSSSALEQAAQGVGKAAAVYDGLSLLGQIPLTGIVDDAFGLLPQAVTEVVDGRQTVTLTMTPSLHEYALGPIVFVPGALVLTSVTAAGGDRPAEQSLDALLSDATLQLAGVVKMPINRLRVTSATGAPLDVELDLGDLAFLGPLGFVQTLAEVLVPLLAQGRVAGAHARPAARGALSARRIDVDVDTQGVHLSQAIAFPDVSVGVFTLTGLGFGFGLDLLFAGGLVADFSFASHDNPFQVSYGPFGGGGYCALRLTGGEITNLEVSLMVAGGFGLNLGVAAGAVSVQAGLVLCLPKGEAISLTAFFRASGCLEVLGLVSVSVVFEIALTYADTDPVSLYGSATLSMKVEVMWVSKTVKASVTKTLTGGAKKSGVPASAMAPGAAARKATEQDRPFAFRDTYPERAPWQEYAAAYASARG